MGDLLEREAFLDLLRTRLSTVRVGEGHCLFLSGESGIGKTSLVRAFCKELDVNIQVLQGACDAFFTPRPLAPIFDIALQLQPDFRIDEAAIPDSIGIFTKLLQELLKLKKTCIIIFEDIHWADEATLDFIRFLARRISQLRCLFILTYRDNEISFHHPLRNVFGQLPSGIFSRVRLTPLSKEVVKKLSEERGYNGDEVYSVTNGNPFYVNEILASYSPGVPDNIKDSVLSVYNRQEETTKQVWEVLSVIPTAFGIKYLEKLEPQYAPAIEQCLESQVLIIKEGFIFFKHELFRRAIEIALSPFKRVSLNRKIISLLQESFAENGEIERIIHHAKNANDYETVVHYAPLAAKKAATLGAHIEAARLYLTAIEYYQGSDKDLLIQFYEGYAYESYLTNQIKEAIIYSLKVLDLLKEKNDTLRAGNSMRFLSRLWWIEGNQEKAEDFAGQAIEVFEKQAPSSAKAMAYSNMSQLKMFSDLPDESIFWGNKAIEMAGNLGDKEILAYALSSVGSVQIKIPSSQQKGLDQLQQSLAIGLENSYHEHIARAYTNLGHNGIIIKEYELARKALEAGIQYSEENNLGLWSMYLLAAISRLKLDTGEWDEACRMAESLINNGESVSIIKVFALTVLASVKMRRGSNEDILSLLGEAKDKAFETMELQRIIRALTAFLEYEWISGQRFIDKEALDNTISRVEKMGNIYENSEFAYWLFKARKQELPLKERYEGYDTGTITKAQWAAGIWKKCGSPYNEALALSEGTHDDKRKAILIFQELGAYAVAEKLKAGMRDAGIKGIPRGIRKSTQSNPAFLTGRELDVLQLLKEGMQNKEIAVKLFISAKTVDNHISSILFKLDVNSRTKAVQEAVRQEIIK